MTPDRFRAGRAWWMWGVGVTAYLVAVFQRYSLGVAGLAAADRFGISASALATFSVVQLAVYAGMQIPVGVLLDRFGSTRMLVAGGITMVAGQALFAEAHAFGPAVVARMLLGAGDAMTFISVLRIIAFWFPSRLNPLVTQLTGLIGAVGAIVSAVPLVHALHSFGWTTTFLLTAAIGAATCVFVWSILHDAPGERHAVSKKRAGRRLRANLRDAWAHPGTRLGLWSHFTTVFPATVFTMLWGYPFLVEGQGMSPSGAGTMLTALTVANIITAPLMGHAAGKRPIHRSTMVLAVVGATVAVWTAVLLWPGRAPLWLLVLLVVVMGTNGPGSLIGFDFARSFNPTSRLGTASGIVNVGGFTASLVTILLIGVVLDAVTTGSPATYSLGAFRTAFCVQYAVWTLGVVQVVRYRVRSRRRLATDDPDTWAAMHITQRAPRRAR